MEILKRLFASPHRAETLAALRQGHRHAVHAGDRVEQRTQRVVEIAVVAARALYVLGQTNPVRGERSVDAAQHRQRSRLVVNRIEGGDEVEGSRLGRLVEIAEVARREFDFFCAMLGRFLPGERNGLFR
ncbi:MAG TPA: hypothetical protein VJY34_04455 [Roseiarcus sp.]|nr:hypothetical protein [Roseiarcus sp.]